MNDTDKVIIFCHHHMIHDAIKNTMSTYKVNFITIDGRTKTSDRQSRVSSFQNDENIKIAILGIKSAGTGLNLFRANMIVFTELLWNQKDMLQAEDRAHRIGQERTLTIKYLLLGGSTDDIIWMSLNSKVNVTSIVLDNKRTYLHTIDNHDNKNKKIKH